MTALNLATSDIVSLAFLAMEKTPPASFDDDSEEAALTAQFYPTALERCLERTDWSFASTYVELPELILPSGAAADPNLPYTFSLPGDALKLREVGTGATRWRQDKVGDVRALRANQPAPLAVRYTARLENETLLPAAFRNAVGLQLAIYLAPKFLGTATKISELKKDLNDALNLAEREDSRTASEARYDDLPDQGDWATEATW